MNKALQLYQAYVERRNKKNNSKMKLGTLILSGVGTIIGSGWLFGSAHVAALAGPMSILSWILGALIVLVIALNLVAISRITPASMGSMGYFLNYTHGSFASFLAQYTILIGFISSVPSEATASVQYLSEWHYVFTQGLFDRNLGVLTNSGINVASALCVVYFIINYFSLSLLAKSIKLVTIFKLFVPIISCISLIAIGVSSNGVSNLYLVGDHTLSPYGFNGVLTAITTAGVIYAFNGFQTPITFASEVENPKRNIPIAIIASVLIAGTIYIGLQVAYLLAMPHDTLLHHGWRVLNFNSPFASLAVALNMNLIALLLYFDAVVSPSGAGIIYTSLSARVMCGMQPHMPNILTRIDKNTGLPRFALILILLLSFVSLWFFPSWDKLAGVISVGYVICYSVTPVVNASFTYLKHKDNNLYTQSFKQKIINLIAPLGFILSTYMLYWSKWPLNGEIILLVLSGLPIYFYYAMRNNDMIFKEMLHALWFILYLIFIAIFAYLGSSDFGGINFIKAGFDYIVLTIFAILFFLFGVKSSYKTNLYHKEIK